MSKFIIKGKTVEVDRHYWAKLYNLDHSKISDWAIVYVTELAQLMIFPLGCGPCYIDILTIAEVGEEIPGNNELIKVKSDAEMWDRVKDFY